MLWGAPTNWSHNCFRFHLLDINRYLTDILLVTSTVMAVIIQRRSHRLNLQVLLRTVLRLLPVWKIFLRGLVAYLQSWAVWPKHLGTSRNVLRYRNYACEQFFGVLLSFNVFVNLHNKFVKFFTIFVFTFQIRFHQSKPLLHKVLAHRHIYQHQSLVKQGKVVFW